MGGLSQFTLRLYSLILHKSIHLLQNLIAKLLVKRNLFSFLEAATFSGVVYHHEPHREGTPHVAL